MKEKLVFATHNQHKTEEVKQMLDDFEILNLNEINFYDEIVENGKTFHENAEIKVDAISEKFEGAIFGDDSGLVIPALDGEPGIYSARYAETGNSKDNIEKVLEKLNNIQQREAYFITVICLLYQGKKYFFEGIINGKILQEIEGKEGFGYDPIFQPNGYKNSFATLGNEIKNKISHRANAIEQLKLFLSEQS